MILKKNKELILLTLVILLATILRTYDLTLPLGFHGDEGWTGLEARRIIQSGFIGFWSISAFGQAALPFYWTALFFHFFGESIQVARLSFAILSIFSIIYFYLFVRLLFSFRIALLATFLLATSNVILAFSRRADFIAVHFAFFPALYFTIKAFQTNSLRYFLLSGLCIGLILHTYASYWAAVGVFAILYGFYFIKKLPMKENVLLNILASYLAFLLIASPMMQIAFTTPEKFFGRSYMVSLFSPYPWETQHVTKNVQTLLWENITKTSLMFTEIQDGDYWNSLNDKPLFGRLLSFFFIFGLIIAICHIREKRYSLMLIFFFFFLLLSITTIDAPSYRRTQGSIFIAFIFIAVGMESTFAFMQRKTYFTPSQLMIPYLTLIICIGALSSFTYFAKNAVSKATQNALAYPLVRAAEHVHSLSNDSFVYFYSSRFNLTHETFQFLAPFIKGESSTKSFNSTMRLEPKYNNYVFILMDDYVENLTEIEKKYPGGKTTVDTNKDGTVNFISYALKKK